MHEQCTFLIWWTVAFIESSQLISNLKVNEARMNLRIFKLAKHGTVYGSYERIINKMHRIFNSVQNEPVEGNLKKETSK